MSSPSLLPKCRSCGADLHCSVVDLGDQPLANSYLASHLDISAERTYPLHARFCTICFLVQVDDVVPAEEIFSDYAYFSSYSDTWVAHARKFANEAVARFELSRGDRVVEIASNDGYLLRFFAEAGMDVLGVEPAANVAAVAERAGVPTVVEFFGYGIARDLVSKYGHPHLIVANNVLAHVPDLGDFISGLRELCAPTSIVSIEVPHLLNLIKHVQFDTIYHEHFSYFSLMAAERALGRGGLRVFDVDRIPTHGGSIRLLATQAESSRPTTARVDDLRIAEREAGLDRVEAFGSFSDRVDACRASLLNFLSKAVRNGEKVVGYGAAAKGNTLLNYCGIGPEQIPYVVDRSPHKQGHLLPGSHLRVRSPEVLLEDHPEYLLILPWNLESEIIEQMAVIREWNGRFVVAIPTTRVLP